MISADISLPQQFKDFKPSLIFFDIDGTLLDTQGNYSPTLQQQLQRLKNQGVKLAIASGRPAIAAQFLFDELAINDAGLFCTGAELYNPKKQEHLQLHCLAVDELKFLYERIRFHKLYCEFYSSRFYTAGNNSDISSIHSQHLRVSPQDMAPKQILEGDFPLIKLLLGTNNKKAANELELLALEFPQFEFAFAHFLARPDWVFASVVSRAANKEMGFKQLLDYHQVNAKEVMAFGDSHSDMVFLEHAGLGVAMGNAGDKVKAVADMVTLSADDDGVAKILSQF